MTVAVDGVKRNEGIVIGGLADIVDIGGLDTDDGNTSGICGKGASTDDESFSGERFGEIDFCSQDGSIFELLTAAVILSAGGDILGAIIARGLGVQGAFNTTRTGSKS